MELQWTKKSGVYTATYKEVEFIIKKPLKDSLTYSLSLNNKVVTRGLDVKDLKDYANSMAGF